MGKQFCKKCNQSVNDADAVVNNLEFLCPQCNEQLVYFGSEIVKLSPQHAVGTKKKPEVPTCTQGSIELSEKTNYKLDPIFLSIQAALKDKPNDPKIRLELGHFYAAKQLDDLAIDTYQSIIDTHPKVLLAYKRLASLYAGKKAYLSALNYLKRAAQLAPRDTMIFYNLAIAFMHCQDRDNAEKSINHALLVAKSDSERMLIHDLGEKLFI